MDNKEGPETEAQSEHIFQFNNAGNQSTRILEAAHKYWQAREYCDAERIVGVQEECIPVHKIILVSFSDYFCGLLNPHMKEGKQMSVRCAETLQASAMIKLIDFCYTGQVTLDVESERIEDLLEAADYLRLKDLCDAISDFLGKNLSDENCYDLLKCADHFQLTELRAKAMNHITMNYHLASQTEDFLSLPEMYLIEILQSEKIAVHTEGVMASEEDQEHFVVQSVLKYFDSNTAVEKRLPNFLQLLKLPLLSKDKLAQLKTQTRIQASPDCLKIIDRAAVTEPTDVNNCDGSPWSRPRNGVRLLLREFHECAGGGHVDSEVKKFNCRDILNPSPRAHVSGFKIGVRRWDGRPVIGGLEIYYSTGKKESHGMDPSLCEDTHQFHLKQNERIIKVDVRNGWMIDCLRFHTNLGNKYGPYGGNGGSEYSEGAPDDSFGYLAGVSGSVVQTQGSEGITRLKFMWGFYDASDEQERYKCIQLIDREDLLIFPYQVKCYFVNAMHGDLVYSITLEEKSEANPEESMKRYVHLRSGEAVTKAVRAGAEMFSPYFDLSWGSYIEG